MIRFLAGFAFAFWVMYSGAIVFAFGVLSGAGLAWLYTRRRRRAFVAAPRAQHERELLRLMASR